MIDEIPNPPQDIKGMNREPQKIEKGKLVKFASAEEEEAFRTFLPDRLSPDGSYVVLDVEPNGTIHLGPSTMSPQDVRAYDYRKNYDGDERYEKSFGIQDASMIRLLTN
jgi:hypothetical protein